MTHRIQGLFLLLCTGLVAPAWAEYCHEAKPDSWYKPEVRVMESSLPLSVRVDYGIEQYAPHRSLPFFNNSSKKPFFIGYMEKDTDGKEVFVANEKYVEGQAFLKNKTGAQEGQEWFPMNITTRLYGMFFAEGLSRADAFATFEPMPEKLPAKAPQQFKLKAQYGEEMMDIEGTVRFVADETFTVRKEFCLGDKAFPFKAEDAKNYKPMAPGDQYKTKTDSEKPEKE